MTFFAALCLFVGLCLLLAQRVRTLLTYFQQEEYDGRRFVDAWRRVRLFDVWGTSATLIATLVISGGGFGPLASIALGAALAAIAYRERSHRFKKPLAMTERAVRVYRSALIALLLLAFLTFLHPLFAVVPLQLAPAIMIFSNRLLKPIQERINANFEEQARVKLRRLNPTRIGITGSFGKTTVKHMLAEILEASGPVYFSRGSINTVLGHTRHIRQRLQWAHKYFVAEMGAYGIGSIKRLCDFVEPTFGIVTAVGDAHTERFGSIENIAIAKAELAFEVCARGGIVVFNADLLKYEPFKEVRQRFCDQVVTVGFCGADVTIQHQELEGGSWSIQLQSKSAEMDGINYELPLLGDHNVLNSALAVVLAVQVDPGVTDRIPFFTRTISQVPHRLQKLSSPGLALILDDAYNSNELGFKSAVSSLDKLAKQRGGRRILVTPGIAELGLEHDRVHERLGQYCSENCDLIYVVNPARIKSFTVAASSSDAKVIEVPTFADARGALSGVLREEDVVLYENDLPDILEERRIL